MFGSLGLPELFIFFVILQLIAIVHFVRRRPKTYWLLIIIFLGGPGAVLYLLVEMAPDVGLTRHSTGGFSRRRRIIDVAAEPYDASPGRRYERGVWTGTLAELFGLGINGIRWRQVTVVVIGTWLSDSVFTLPQSLNLEGLSPQHVILMTLWPMIFVFSAVTAIRSFQSGLAIAVVTGALYSLLYTSIRFVAFKSDALSFEMTSFWIHSVAASFIWPALTMFALEFAASGIRRWTRMLCGLFVASVVELYMSAGIYRGTWDPQELASQLVRLGISALIWTAAFWIGLTRYGHQRE
jgi:hypothetical protein